VEQAGKAPAVLIVEDEALIRMGAVRMIEDAGFEVIEAANADEAIQILESRSGIRVVFTDIHMPGSMDGLKLAHAVRNRWPPIKIIVTSGRELLTEHDLPDGGRFLSKPYNPFFPNLTTQCKSEKHAAARIHVWGQRRRSGAGLSSAVAEVWLGIVPPRERWPASITSRCCVPAQSIGINVGTKLTSLPICLISICGVWTFAGRAAEKTSTEVD
jgi:CheY-like chemotaxis protein